MVSFSKKARTLHIVQRSRTELDYVKKIEFIPPFWRPPAPPAKLQKVSFSVRFRYDSPTPANTYVFDINGTIVTRERDPHILKTQIAEVARDHFARDPNYAWALDQGRVEVIITRADPIDFYESPELRVKDLIKPYRAHPRYR